MSFGPGLRRAVPVLAAVAAACATAPRRETAPPPSASPPNLNAVLWVHTAAEYDAAARQAFRAARAALDRALADSSWTAAVEQVGDYRALPPAVITDVDESVLENSPFEARLIREGKTFNPASWSAWVDSAAARPVPGALEFARYAASRGVTIFYVTNRDEPLEAGTRRDLEAAGLPVDPDRDVVLMRGERPGWSSDKGSRRLAVAKEYRILLVIGDDLNDFVAARSSPARRDSLVARYADRWGERWIVLPDPMYGSWESALWDFRSGLSPAEKARARWEALGPR